jgi:molybdopterin synthase catalytic subunit
MKFRKIIGEMREKWDLKNVAVFHRLGSVPVGETSVSIGVSSVHRREALEAVAYCIDELKARVPIWKKEVYQDGTSWKQNAEFDPTKLKGCGCDHDRAH